MSDFCPNCGDDRTGKGSLLTPGKAFCNELCVMEWQVKRIAELKRQNSLLRAVAKAAYLSLSDETTVSWPAHERMLEALKAVNGGGAMDNELSGERP